MLATYISAGLFGTGGGIVVPPSSLLAQFRIRYPAFAAVSDDTVSVWLDDGEVATASWPEDVRARATMLYAAHKLASQGLGAGTIAAGVTSFRSGAFSATVSDKVASLTGFSATSYGRDYLALMRLHFGGPRLAWNPPAQVW